MSVLTLIIPISVFSCPTSFHSSGISKLPHALKGRIWETIGRTTYGSLLYSHASKVILELKILQARLQQYRELVDVQAGFRKCRGPRDQIANVLWIMEKAREFQKNIYFCFIDYAKAFDCVDHNKLWKILQVWEYQTTWPASWEICMQVRKQQLELDM